MEYFGYKKSGEARESERIWETKSLQSFGRVLPEIASDGLGKFSEIKSLEKKSLGEAREVVS